MSRRNLKILVVLLDEIRVNAAEMPPDLAFQSIRGVSSFEGLILT
jgi:hypothetical protein